MTSPDIEKSLRRKFEAELEGRIRRTKELKHQYQPYIGAHYFAEASYHCLELYRDGYMLGCITCSEALLEAVLKFVLQRNRLNSKGEVEDHIKVLKDKGILTGKVLDAVNSAWRHRNDFLHLNPGVSAIELEPKAKQCIGAICTLENEIFGGTFREGAFIPKKQIYWDIIAEGTVPVFLRQLDV
jgi:hypothetical protein